MGHLAAHLTLATSRDAAPLRPRPGKGAANYQNYHLLPGRGVASSLRMGAAPLTCPAREMDPFFFLSFLSFPPFRTFASVSNFSCLENGKSKKKQKGMCPLDEHAFTFDCLEILGKDPGSRICMEIRFTGSRHSLPFDSI